MTTHAITHHIALTTLDSATIAALEAGEPHSLTSDDIARDWTEFASETEAAEALERAGGGWLIDEDGNTTWIAGYKADLTRRCRELLHRLRVGSLSMSSLPIDVVNTLAERGLVEPRPDAPSQLRLTGRGRGVDPSTFDA